MRNGYRDTGLIEAFLDLAGHVPVDLPVIFGGHPGANDELDRRLVELMESDHRFRRGAEKGVFAFGGSTVVLLFEHDRVAVDHDILAHSQQGIETLVRYGEAIGQPRTGKDK